MQNDLLYVDRLSMNGRSYNDFRMASFAATTAPLEPFDVAQESPAEGCSAVVARCSETTISVMCRRHRRADLSATRISAVGSVIP